MTQMKKSGITRREYARQLRQEMDTAVGELVGG